MRDRGWFVGATHSFQCLLHDERVPMVCFYMSVPQVGADYALEFAAGVGS